MAAYIIIDAAELAHLGDRLIAAGARSEAVIAEQRAKMMVEIRDIAQPIVVSHTPVATGALAGSTDSRITEDMVEIIQPLTVTSHVATWTLAPLLYAGHDIVTKDRNVVGHYPGTHYDQAAADEMHDDIDVLVAEKARVMALEVDALI